MSFSRDPMPDACRAWMPSPVPKPPGPPSPPLVCHMPNGHDGQHSPDRHPGPISRRWEGDARPATAPKKVIRIHQLLHDGEHWFCCGAGEEFVQAASELVDDHMLTALLPLVEGYARAIRDEQ